jgi:uncharacterized protein (DUF885 family)
MKNHTAFAPEMIAREIDRYSTWPAQATTYMIGKIKIQELREKAEDSLCTYNGGVHILFNVSLRGSK